MAKASSYSTGVSLPSSRRAGWRRSGELRPARLRTPTSGSSSYSLPDYDVAIRGLLSRAAHGQRVVVRDPLAADIVPRYAALLPDCEVTTGPPL